MNNAESILSSSAFNLTDRLQIFSYLVSPNRVRWYRLIMRIFLQRHRELYRYQLTAQEVRDEVRETFDAEYTLEQCQSDLAALKEWGNIITFYDSSRATSIASFLSPALLYQATPAAIAVETFLDEQARASANYAAQLDTLARQLLSTRDGETAQQLFSVAFANLLPVHLPEGLVGTPSSVYEPTHSNAWQEPPAVTLQLRPVSRSSHGNLPLEDPIIDNRTLLRELVAQHENRNREQRERFARLFADSYLDIGTIESITPDDRSVLMEVIDACLGQSQNQYRAPDGSIITLLNPGEQMYTVLRASDGVLLLPRYLLERQEEPVEASAFDDSILQAQ